MPMLSDLQLVNMVPRNSTQLLNINTTKFQVEREHQSMGIEWALAVGGGGGGGGRVGTFSLTKSINIIFRYDIYIYCLIPTFVHCFDFVVFFIIHLRFSDYINL